MVGQLEAINRGTERRNWATCMMKPVFFWDAVVLCLSYS